MIYSHEVEMMCPVAQGVAHGAAPIPEEAKWVKAKEIKDISGLTTEYCMKVLCLARLMVPQSDIRCAAGREVYFKGEEKKLLSVVDSIFASGYLTADGQGIQDTIKTIEDAGFTYEIESA